MPKAKGRTKSRPRPAQQARSLRASEYLTSPTSVPNEILKLIGWPKPSGWPLTVEEFATLSPAEAIRIAKAERRKPTMAKLMAWLEKRLFVASKAAAAAPDETTAQHISEAAFKEAWADVQEALAQAHTASRDLSQTAGKESARIRQRKSDQWKEDLARFYRTSGLAPRARTSDSAEAKRLLGMRAIYVQAVQTLRDGAPADQAQRLQETVTTYALLADLPASDGPLRKHLGQLLPKQFPALFK